MELERNLVKRKCITCSYLSAIPIPNRLSNIARTKGFAVQ